MTPATNDVDRAKEAAALAACELVDDGSVVGLGTGSTAVFAIKRLGEMVAEGLEIQAVPTSLASMELARHLGIPLTTLADVGEVDLTIDGADEVAPNLDLIKGLGGALLREKVVASVTKREVIIVDEAKLVSHLGARSPLPLEVMPFGEAAVKRHLAARGFEAALRRGDDGPFVTDNGNRILDLDLASAGSWEPRELERDLDAIPGVLENGFFLGLTWRALVGSADGSVRTLGR